MRKQKAEYTLSFLHNDIRPDNMIYNNGSIFVLDAEECEFGDPLHELARISQVDDFQFLKGYKSESDIDINNLYLYYKLEELGMLLDCHFNRGACNSLTQTFLDSFSKKTRIIIKRMSILSAQVQVHREKITASFLYPVEKKRQTCFRADLSLFGGRGEK